jgi:hypothetical protein
MPKTDAWILEELKSQLVEATLWSSVLAAFGSLGVLLITIMVWQAVVIDPLLVLVTFTLSLLCLGASIGIGQQAHHLQRLVNDLQAYRPRK